MPTLPHLDPDFHAPVEATVAACEARGVRMRVSGRRSLSVGAGSTLAPVQELVSSNFSRKP